MIKRFVKDLAMYAPSQFLPAITAFITTPILTRLLAPAEYGYWAQAANLSGLLTAVAVSGMGSAALRFYPAYEAKAKAPVFFATIGVSVAAMVTVIAGLSFLALALLRAWCPPWLVELLPLAIMIFVANGIFTVYMAVIRAQGRSGVYTALQLLTNYGGLGLGLLLVMVFGFRVKGLLWGTLLAVAPAVPFLIALASRKVGMHLREFRMRDALEFWRYAWPLALGAVAMWGLRVSDLFIISSFRPARDVGLYSVSYNISSKSIELLVSLFLLGVSPLLYRTWETEGREATETALTMVTRVYLIVCLPAAVGLSVLALPFVALLTAPEYYEGSRIVGFVVFSSFIWGLASLAMMGLTIKQQARRLGANNIIAAAIHIGLQLLLVPRFGYVAAAISTFIGFTALLVLQTVSSRPHLAWRFPFATLRNVIAASVVMGAAAWGIHGIAGGSHRSSALSLLLSVTLAVPIYGACLWWLGEVKDAEKTTVFTLWDRATRA